MNPAKTERNIFLVYLIKFEHFTMRRAAKVLHISSTRVNDIYRREYNRV